MIFILSFSTPCLLLLSSIHIAQSIILQSIYQQYLQQGLEFRENIYLGNKPILSEYDFIIVGGGTAGSVVANRLSENPNWKILLLESGEDETIYQDIPLLSHFNSLTGFNWGYKLEKNNEHPQCLAMYNQQCPCPRGKGLGGSSILNYMIYTRGNKKDFDSYEAAGNKGWGYQSVLKYFLKLENNTSEFLDPGSHSTSGPLKVQNIPYPNLLTEKFIQSACELGYPIYDYTGENPATEGFSKLQATLSKGQRYSASRAYLKNIKKRSSRNLHVAIATQVTKIVIDSKSKKTHGVEFQKNGVKRVVLVKKEVILSAGAINDPQLLMLSGIGPATSLKEFNIDVLSDLRGVGQNLNDHHSYFGLTFLMNRTNTGSTIEKKIVNVDQFLRWLNFGRGPFTVPGGVTGIGYMNTKYNNDRSWPDTEYLFTIGSFNSDAGRILRKSLNIRKDVYDSVFKNIDNLEVWSIIPVVLRPKARGSIKLKSKNPFKFPKIYYDFFQHEEDERIMLEAIKNVIKISETDAFQSIGSRLHNTPVPDCAQYEFGCDDYWKCAMRYFTSSLYHQSGTCKMGTQLDKDAVVDEKLQVYGVSNLRVVDASVFPTVPSAHLYAPTVMVAEKASDMIKEKWKNYNETVPHKNRPCYNSNQNIYPNKNLCKPNNASEIKPTKPCHSNQLDNQKCNETSSTTTESLTTSSKVPENYKPTVPNQANFIQIYEMNNISMLPNQTNVEQSWGLVSNEPTTTIQYLETTQSPNSSANLFSGYPSSKPEQVQRPSESFTYPPFQPVQSNYFTNQAIPSNVAQNQHLPEKSPNIPLTQQKYPPDLPLQNNVTLYPFMSNTSSIQQQSISYPVLGGYTESSVPNQFGSQNVNPSESYPTYINIVSQSSANLPPPPYEAGYHAANPPYNYQNNQAYPPQINNQHSPHILVNPQQQTTFQNHSFLTNEIDPNENIVFPYSVPTSNQQTPMHDDFQILSYPVDTAGVNRIRPNTLFDIPYYNQQRIDANQKHTNKNLIPATIFIHPEFLFANRQRYFSKRNSKEVSAK